MEPNDTQPDTCCCGPAADADTDCCAPVPAAPSKAKLVIFVLIMGAALVVTARGLMKPPPNVAPTATTTQPADCSAPCSDSSACCPQDGE